MGPLLRKEGYKLYYPGKGDAPIVTDYYSSEYQASPTTSLRSGKGSLEKAAFRKTEEFPAGDTDAIHRTNEASDTQMNHDDQSSHAKDLAKVDALPWAHPKRIYATIKLVLT